MRTTLALLLFPFSLMAQLPSGGNVLPLNGLPSLVYASSTPAGTVVLSPPVTVMAPSGYVVTQDRVRATLTITPPVTPAIPTRAAWITLSPSPSDPLTWCVMDNPLTFTYVPSMLHVSVSLTITTVPGAGVWSREEFTDIQPAPTQGQGSTSVIPPQWVKGACGGNPGVVFPSNGLNTGEARTAVQARVVF